MSAENSRVIATDVAVNDTSMKRSISPLVIAFAISACDGRVDDDSLDEVSLDEVSFRAELHLDMGPPAPNAPVVATLSPGDVFEIGHRYAFAKAPGVSATMSQFHPSNVDQIPHLRSGDVIAVERGGEISRVRIRGLGETGGIAFVPQQASPFTHAFLPIPWSAWGAGGSAVAGCSQAVEDEWQPCVDITGNGGWCSDQAEEELDDCASGQSFAVSGNLGGTGILMFECMLPHPYSMIVFDESMTMGGCEGSFTGVVTQEPGFFGCEDVYDGIWTADDPDCMEGPADMIVLHEGG